MTCKAEFLPGIEGNSERVKLTAKQIAGRGRESMWRTTNQLQSPKSFRHPPQNVWSGGWGFIYFGGLSPRKHHVEQNNKCKSLKTGKHGEPK